jgi:hypothetical protein
MQVDAEMTNRAIHGAADDRSCGEPSTVCSIIEDA